MINPARLIGNVAIGEGSHEVVIKFTVIHRDNNKLFTSYLCKRFRQGSFYLISPAEAGHRLTVRKYGTLLGGNDIAVTAHKHNIGLISKGDVCKKCIAEKGFIKINKDVTNMLTQTCTAVNFTADNDFVTASIGVDILKGVMRGGFINFFYNLGKTFGIYIIIS